MVVVAVVEDNGDENDNNDDPVYGVVLVVNV
jgi:hypothetical protein